MTCLFHRHTEGTVANNGTMEKERNKNKKKTVLSMQPVA